MCRIIHSRIWRTEVYLNSGCSGHMTGNKDHLYDFKEYKGGSVTFRGSKGYITGKGRIRVGNLDFETPKGKDSGEADISPSGLQAVETLVHVASQKTKTYTRRVKSGLKKKLDVGVSSGDRCHTP
ncbi:hypothetical protein Tco_0315109 [Tanacetum coccineum]